MKTSDVVANLRTYVKSVCKDFPPALCGLIVFGSYARGCAKIGSDLDIALLGSDEFRRSDRVAMREILSGFYEHIDIKLFCTNQEKLELTDCEFDANYWIRKEGELLWQR